MINRGNNDGGYEVGYGKPPRGTQFRKGTSGNPKGRPRGAKSIRAILEKMGRKRVKMTNNGQSQMVTMLEAMVMQLSTQAASGNLKAIRDVFAAHRIFVEPEQAPEAETNFGERDLAVLKSLQRRLQNFNKTEIPGEDN